MSIVPSPKLSAIGANCLHLRALLGIFQRLSFGNYRNTPVGRITVSMSWINKNITDIALAHRKSAFGGEADIKISGPEVR
jgi:hypothetical protein